MNYFFLIYILLSLISLNGYSQDRTTSPVRRTYNLTIDDTLISVSGKIQRALMINRSIPAPQLVFTEGDTAEIIVYNALSAETSLHWHGLILPNEQDGVPYLTTAPIQPGTTVTYRFPIVQNGTYWYHSHTGLQEQMGLYGAFIIRKRNAVPEKEYTLVLSDWSNEKPKQIHRSLHNATDWYAIGKGATQNYVASIREGYFSVKLENEMKRMLAMDVSDVFYNQFWVNGQPEQHFNDAHPGDTVRLRIINGSASTYFWIRYAAGKMKVVASDGKDVEPVAVDRFIIAVSETYDIRIVIPETGSAELIATSEDRTNSASVFLGNGTPLKNKPLPRLKYFEGMQMMNDMTTLSGNMTDMGMNMTNQQMDMNTVMYPEIADSNEQIVTLNYGMLRSPEKTTLPDSLWREMRFELTGNMNRYIWTLDNKTVSESDKILIRKGENVRIILYNNSMMRHPMHLHGHFFRVLNGSGDYSPLKNVLDIMPMETDTIEFAATESGDWFFHCHILYHMMSGMGRIFSYEDSPVNTQFEDPEKALKKLYKDDKEWHFMAHIDVATNGSDGELMYSNTRYRLDGEWRVGWMGDFETETHFSRFFGRKQFFAAYAGTDYRLRQEGIPQTKDNRQVFCAGLQYMLPFFIQTDFRVDHTGRMRLQFTREDLPLTSRIRLTAMYNTDREWMVGGRYILTKYLAISTHYDSDMKWGIGVKMTY